MYSPSDLFQLQALQSPAPGRDHTRFTLNVITASIIFQPDNPYTVPDKTGKAVKNFCWQKDRTLSLNLCFRLLTDSKFLNYGAILGNILLFQVLQKPSPLTDEFQ
jgi:hypothetical protein